MGRFNHPFIIEREDSTNRVLFLFVGGIKMPYVLTTGGCFFPVQPSHSYNVLPTIEEGETVKTMELIDKQKNGFGDMIFFIRDDKGFIYLIWEKEVDAFLNKHGVTSLIQGSPYEYLSKP
jgi:hypothetical protein